MATVLMMGHVPENAMKTLIVFRQAAVHAKSITALILNVVPMMTVR